MGNLLTFAYWFNLNPEPFLAHYLTAIYGIITLFILAGLVSWYFIKKNEDDIFVRKFWKKLQFFCLTMGIILWILVFARQERIVFVGMPLLLLFALAGAMAWVYFLIKYTMKTLPEKKAEKIQKQEKEKYFN